MNPIQFEPPAHGRELTEQAGIDPALADGVRLRPRWMDRFIGWWVAPTAVLRPAAAGAPDPAPRGCLS